MREPTPWRRWQEIGLGAMGMTEEAFFAQSIILWKRRIDGFLELHGAGKNAHEPLTRDELEALMEDHPD